MFITTAFGAISTNFVVKTDLQNFGSICGFLRKSFWRHDMENTQPHLNYVTGYTGPFLFLFERTHNYYVDNQGLVPMCLLHCFVNAMLGNHYGPRVSVIQRRTVTVQFSSISTYLIFFLGSYVRGISSTPCIPSPRCVTDASLLNYSLA